MRTASLGREIMRHERKRCSSVIVVECHKICADEVWVVGGRGRSALTQITGRQVQVLRMGIYDYAQFLQTSNQIKL